MSACDHEEFRWKIDRYQNIVEVRCVECKRSFTKKEFEAMGLTVKVNRVLKGFSLQIDREEKWEI